MAYVIKCPVPDPDAETFVFTAQKTMYGGKAVTPGDRIYIFDSETAGGSGLIARGVVTRVEAVPPKPGIDRQTPRISLAITREATARRPLGRAQLKAHDDWDDGQPATELNFKFYRQATNKIGGVSDAAAAYLDTFFTD